jgi:putative transposase
MRPCQLRVERKPADNQRKRAHKGRVAVAESNRRWYSDGFEFRCDNGEKLRVTFTQDGCDREIINWATSTGGYDKETVQDVMPGAVEKRFGQPLPSEPLEWLADNEPLRLILLNSIRIPPSIWLQIAKEIAELIRQYLAKMY